MYLVSWTRLSVALLSLFVTSTFPVVLAVASAPSYEHGGPLPRPRTSGHNWPQAMCSVQPGHRFSVTTESAGGLFIAEPPPPEAVPNLTARQAYQHFERLYGHLSSRERAATQVRFGRITDAVEGGLSRNVVGSVPDTRRATAWLVTNCALRTAPRGHARKPGKAGKAFYIIGDSPAVETNGWLYSYERRDGTMTSWYGGGDSAGQPRYSATRYFSAPWRLSVMGPHRRHALLEYAFRAGFCFDHVNVGGERSATVSVILSTGPNGRPCSSSGTKPYADAYADGRSFATLKHAPTGPRRFLPERFPPPK